MRRFSLVNAVKRRKYWIIGIVVLFLLFLLIPSAHFRDPYSTVVAGHEGELLGAKVAADGQWRFPPSDQLPEKYVKALLCFEDRWFYYHPGVNPVSMFRALFQYIREGKIISGGSTITMQVARISRKNRPRSIWQKIIESVTSLRTELVCSKHSILVMYASNAPFGGNVVGLEAASWRFFGESPQQLSWAEAATLAVLPNSPSLVFPGRGQQKLLKKRNQLLEKMFRQGIIDAQTYALALSEPVPGAPHSLPKDVPHLLERAIKDGFDGKRVSSTVDGELQQRVDEVLNRYSQGFRDNQVFNAAVVVVSTKTGKVICYSGNTRDDPEGGDVDMITAKRSYGSLLKPFLYASMLNEGLLLPEMLVNDIPVSFRGYTPKNVMKNFEGMVPADEVLSRSLNVPSILLLQRYGVGKFNAMLKEVGMRTLRFPPEHYGLSVILGGAEGTLWELTSMYAAFGHRLLFPGNDSLRVSYIQNGSIPRSSFWLQRFSLSPVWFTLKAITALQRPEDNGTLRYFSSTRKVAWKTGTSFGSRDGWAIGVTPEYTVGVWIGNADGEGRPGLTGIGCAAPVMFDVFGLLPPTGWFEEPAKEMVSAKICVRTGFIAGEDCPETEIRKIMAVANMTRTCPYHHLVHLDETETWQVADHCYSPSKMVTRSWFVLPPVQEYFYRQYHSNYLPLPPFQAGCSDQLSLNKPIGLIYPYPGSKIYLPLDRDLKRTHSIWKAAHRSGSATLYWNLDHKFLGKTTGNHIIEVIADPGVHHLTLMDEDGESLTTTVEIIGMEKMGK